MSARRILTLAIAAARTMAGPASLWANPGGKDKTYQTAPPGQSIDKGSKGKGGKTGDDSLGSLITATEHLLIHDYFRQPPYSAKKLPPGIAKNPARGKPLPLGIAKRCRRDCSESCLPGPGGWSPRPALRFPRSAYPRAARA